MDNLVQALKRLGGKRITIKMRRTGVVTFLRKKRKMERAMKKLPPMYFKVMEGMDCFLKHEDIDRLFNVAPCSVDQLPKICHCGRQLTYEEPVMFIQIEDAAHATVTVLPQ